MGKPKRGGEREISTRKIKVPSLLAGPVCVRLGLSSSVRLHSRPTDGHEPSSGTYLGTTTLMVVLDTLLNGFSLVFVW